MASIPKGSTWWRSSRPLTACFARARGPREANAFPALTNGVRAPATIATLCSLTEPLPGKGPPSATPILLPEACHFREISRDLANPRRIPRRTPLVYKELALARGLLAEETRRGPATVQTRARLLNRCSTKGTR